MTPTPEAHVGQCLTCPCGCHVRNALPGTVLTTVDDVARRLHGDCETFWREEAAIDLTPLHGWDAHTAEAARLLGVTE
jgi:hypothetical protein